ncbi:MAG: transposase [Cyanobacteria bacterium MAG IRC4_bin_6]|nr:transposase [Cyanobacteria bacterium MAG IRC4_bin_6]
MTQSIRICGKGFRTADKGVRFPKIGELRLRWSRHLPAPPTSVTIIKDCRDRYFASFVVEVEGQPLPASSKAVGIDLGLTSLAVTSDGETIQPPKFLRSALRRIRRLSRDLSRKEKGPATAPRPASDWPRLTPR